MYDIPPMTVEDIRPEDPLQYYIPEIRHPF